MHGCVRAYSTVKHGYNYEAIGTNQFVLCRRIHGAAAPDEMPTFVELDQPAAIGLGFVPTVVLERREHMAVRQPHVGVRVHISP